MNLTHFIVNNSKYYLSKFKNMLPTFWEGLKDLIRNTYVLLKNTYITLAKSDLQFSKDFYKFIEKYFSVLEWVTILSLIKYAQVVTGNKVIEITFIISFILLFFYFSENFNVLFVRRYKLSRGLSFFYSALFAGLLFIAVSKLVTILASNQ